jgi:hypothetical protein
LWEFLVKKRFLAGVTALLAFISVGVVAAPTASAAVTGNCGSGYTLIANRSIYTGNTTLGWLKVYMKGSTKCVVVDKAGPAYGVSTLTQAWIKLASASSYPAAQQDTGFFTYYAGPVYQANAAGKCISTYALVNAPGGLAAQNNSLSFACN